jgi:hypothetical protein
MNGPSTYELVPVADTGDRFADFAPYVPSIDPRGLVAFHASLGTGGSGIFLASDGSVTDLAVADGLIDNFVSHPDISGDGSWCAYATLRSGEQAVVLGRAGRVAPIADTRDSLTRIGPFGPVMNEAGVVAFRADAGSDRPAIFKADGASIVQVADSRRFGAFHGLPVINGSGRVVFRVDFEGGGQGIIADDDGVPTTLVDTTGALVELGRFPCLNEAGLVAFGATLRDGGAGVFLATGDGVARVADVGEFESVRGALLDDGGGVLFFATPRGGALGVYDAMSRKVLSIGDHLFGSIVTDFALNPVSINGAGQFAIRLKLESGQQLIVRGDPAG